MDGVIDLAATLADVGAVWQPVRVADVNEQEVCVARMRGTYPRHEHPDIDVFFLVVDGELIIEQADGARVRLEPGQGYVVSAGSRHRLVAQPEATVMLLRPRSLMPARADHGLRSRRDGA